MSNKFWKVQAATTQGVGELWIYEEIGAPDYFERLFGLESERISATMVRDELERLGDIHTLHVYINSPGGSVFDAVSISAMLRRHRAEKIVHVDGIAASAASILAMAGDRIVMAPGSMMMIHRASARVKGNAEEISQIIPQLESIDEGMAQTYVNRSDLTMDEALNMMAEETWFNADEAVKVGLADEISGNAVQVAASAGAWTVNNVAISQQMASHFMQKKSEDPTTRTTSIAMHAGDDWDALVLAEELADIRAMRR